MKLTEKAAYIKGLAEGLDLDKTTKEGKLIDALIDMVDAMAEKISDLDSDVEMLNDYAEELDEDLGDVEEVLLGDDDDDYDDECDGDCDGCEYGDFEDETFEVECPSCGEKICFDESLANGKLTCPACGKEINFKVDEDEK